MYPRSRQTLDSVSFISPTVKNHAQTITVIQNSHIKDSPTIEGSLLLLDGSIVQGHAFLSGPIQIYRSTVEAHAQIHGVCTIQNHSLVTDYAVIKGPIQMDTSTVKDHTTLINVPVIVSSILEGNTHLMNFQHAIMNLYMWSNVP